MPEPYDQPSPLPSQVSAWHHVEQSLVRIEQKQDRIEQALNTHREQLAEGRVEMRGIKTDLDRLRQSKADHTALVNLGRQVGELQSDRKWLVKSVLGLVLALVLAGAVAVVALQQSGVLNTATVKATP